MSAHTPEPWTFSTEPQPNGCPIIGAGGLMIAMLAHTTNQADQKETAIANARLIAAAPDLLAEVEREYAELSNVHNSWPGRDTPSGQMKLGRLRDLIAKATGRSEQDVQDDYGNRGTP